MSGFILKIMMILVLSGLVLMVSGHKHVHPYTDDEFISDWLICGPVPDNASENINTGFLPSGVGVSAISPLPWDGYPSNSAPGSEVRLQNEKTENPGRLNFRTYLSANQKSIIIPTINPKTNGVESYSEKQKQILKLEIINQNICESSY